MIRSPTDTTTAPQLKARSLTFRIGSTVTLIWGIILGGSMLAGSCLLPRETLETTLRRDYCLISLGNLFVAYLTLMPLRHFRQSTGREETQAPSKISAPATLGGLILFGMTIRLIGTIALFVACRYQMASSDQLIAGMCIAWYVIFSAVINHAMTSEVKHFDSLNAE